MQSPARNLTAGLSYRYCLWARLGPGTPSASIITPIGLINTAGYGTLRSVQPAVTASWQLLCLAGLQLNSTINGYFTVQLGAAVGSYHLDDASLEFVDAYAPAPAPAPGTVTGMSSSFEAAAAACLACGPDGFAISIQATNASLPPSGAATSASNPLATWEWASGAAARTGVRGLLVGVITAPPQAQAARGVLVQASWGRQQHDTHIRMRARTHARALLYGPHSCWHARQPHALSRLLPPHEAALGLGVGVALPPACRARGPCT